jgi:hypothetical protein
VLHVADDSALETLASKRHMTEDGILIPTLLPLYSFFCEDDFPRDEDANAHARQWADAEQSARDIMVRLGNTSFLFFFRVMSR